MSYPFDIDELRTFVLLADNGHFTETAKILGISQPAVSQRIAKLENSFGLMLFNRLAERAILTPYGAKVLPRSRRCVEQHFSLTARLAAAPASRVDGKLHLWIDRASLGREAEWLAEALIAVSSDVQVVAEVPGGDWQSGLSAGACDGVIAGAFLPDLSACCMTRHSLKREPGLSVLWSAGRDCRAPGLADFEEILDRELVLASDAIHVGFRSFVDDWCSRVHGRMPANVLEVGSCGEVYESVRAGGRIGLIPGSAVARFGLMGEIASRCFFTDMIPKAFECALYTYAAGSEVADKVERLVGHLRSVVDRAKEI